MQVCTVNLACTVLDGLLDEKEVHTTKQLRAEKLSIANPCSAGTKWLNSIEVNFSEMEETALVYHFVRACR